MLRHALSSSQQGLWFLSRIDSRVDAAYNVVLALRASDPIDPFRLQQALHVLQKRHEALRCRIVSELGVPAVEVEDAAQPSGWTLEQCAGDLKRIASEVGNRPFDIGVAPLAYAVLVTPADATQCHGLVFVIPHLLFDDASARVLMQDLQRIDRALLQGEDPTALAPPGSLLEAIDREQTLVGGQKIKALSTAVAERLAGMPERLALPGSIASADTSPVYTGAAVEFELATGLVDSLRIFLRQQRSTPAAGCLAAFLLLLWKTSNQADFGVNVPVANRSGKEMQQVIGYFTNVGIVRARIDPMQTVAGFLAKLNEQLWDLLDARELPFPLLAKQVRRQGGNLQEALLQVGFNHLITDDTGFALGTAKLQPIQVLPEVVKNQLKLDVHESPNGVRGVLLYDRSTIDPETVQGLSDGYSRLLEAMVTEPGMRLRDLPLLSKPQRDAIIALGRGEAMTLPRLGLHQLVEAQAARTPQAIAVAYGQQVLTYAQLNGRANALAHSLRRRGVGRDMLVAVCAERSLELVVALLAVLKAGGAYVPLDPSYPLERLAMMLADSGARTVLVQSAFVDRFATDETVLLLLDEAAFGPEGPDLALPCEAGQLAYCIYTSGSTGKPKGALNTHEGIVNRVLWMQRAYGLKADDVVLQKTPYSFDVSVWEFFWPLVTGACLAMAEPGIHRDPMQLCDVIERHRVTTLHFVPSMLQAFLDAQPHHGLATIRRILCSGEALAPATMRQCLQELPAAELHNLYGPTECAVDVSAWRCHADAGAVRIGRAVANVRLHVLDAQGEPAPVGLAGELHIAGIGVGRGYLNCPELTAEKFVPDPFGDAGSRMYRTGDLARVLADGEIEFLGRLDDQVKIRGFRIELGEVEATLRQCEGIREAVVVAREDEPGDKRLVAYVSSAQMLETARLRERLLQMLPEHMVPTGWVVLDRLPLGPNGKIDRKALPPPQAQAAQGNDYQAPRNELELRLAEIWMQVLKVARVGVHDNFFALGGHSLLAMQVIARTAQQGLGMLTVRALFDSPTIGGLAALLQSASCGAASTASAIDTIPRVQRHVRS